MHCRNEYFLDGELSASARARLAFSSDFVLNGLMVRRLNGVLTCRHCTSSKKPTPVACMEALIERCHVWFYVGRYCSVGKIR